MPGCFASASRCRPARCRVGSRSTSSCWSTSSRCCFTPGRGGCFREGIRATIPPFISLHQLATLRARGLRIEENTIRPGQRTPLTFRADLDLLVHRLGGLDLSRADRVHVKVRVEETGELINENPAAPFDAAGGEVLVACQRHFSALPPNILFEVTPIEAGVAATSARYIIPHHYEHRR
jgi:hypothetical protein